VIDKPIARTEARALEQHLIERFGLSSLNNKINSIANTRALYQYAKQWVQRVGKSLITKL
jgi:hypothetical protein